LFYPGLRFAWDLVGLVLVLGGGGWCHVAKNSGFGVGGKLEKASKREEELEKEQQFKINNIQENNIQKE
jgi:hypothetical protein